MKNTAFMALAACLIAGGAHAGTINFNVSKGWTQGSHTYSGGGVSVDAQAVNVDASGNIVSYSPYIASWTGYSGGIGICNPYTDYGAGTTAGCPKDEHTIDGDGPDEYVLLDFGSTKVDITKITFAYVDHNDDFDIVLYGDGAGSSPTDTDFDNALPNGSSVVTTMNFDVMSGNLFGIGVYGDNDDLKLKAIHFDVEVIPLPAAGWLLLAGVGGLAAMKRRKKA